MVGTICQQFDFNRSFSGIIINVFLLFVYCYDSVPDLINRGETLLLIESTQPNPVVILDLTQHTNFNRKRIFTRKYWVFITTPLLKDFFKRKSVLNTNDNSDKKLKRKLQPTGMVFKTKTACIIHLAVIKTPTTWSSGKIIKTKYWFLRWPLYFHIIFLK